MDEDEPSYTGSKGGLLGCVVGLLFTLLAGFPLLFALAWGGAHCEPVPQCQREGQLAFAGQMAVVVAMATLLGLLVRALFVKSMEERLAGHPGTRPLLLIAIVLLIIGLIAWDLLSLTL